MTTVFRTATTGNHRPIAIDDVPLLSFDDFADTLAQQLSKNTSGLSALFGVPKVEGDPNEGSLRLYAVTNQANKATVSIFATDVGDQYPSLSLRTPQAHWFEREIAEQWGCVPDGHPWLKPIRSHASYVKSRDAWGRSESERILPGVQPDGVDYFKVHGSEVHEVAVGPVHAGVIEPGHFRFGCHGETVFSLEIGLGYQHRGIERQLIGGPDKRTLHLMETAAGDTTIGHATAYCQTLEGLSGITAPLRAHSIRAIALELERLANHTGDLGALAMDVGFLPTASFCGRIRGDWLNATALLCGNRFGRSLVRPAGVRFDLDEARIAQLGAKVKAISADMMGAAELLWSSPSVMARFEDCGVVPRSTAEELGLVGVAGRACGIDRDARRDFPSGIYRFHQIPVSTASSGDVFARAYVRYLEVQRSVLFILEQLESLPRASNDRHLDPLHQPLTPDSIVVSLCEGWRGEICHVAMTNKQGKFRHYKMVDPSFHNWIGLTMALRNQEISDFPVNNKSFNLSYCGHDL